MVIIIEIVKFLATMVMYICVGNYDVYFPRMTDKLTVNSPIKGFISICQIPSFSNEAPSNAESPAHPPSDLRAQWQTCLFTLQWWGARQAVGRATSPTSAMSTTSTQPTLLDGVDPQILARRSFQCIVMVFLMCPYWRREKSLDICSRAIGFTMMRTEWMTLSII